MLKYSAGSEPEHTWMDLGQQCKEPDKHLCVLQPSHTTSIYTGSPDTAGTSAHPGLSCRAKTVALCFPSLCSSGQELCLSAWARQVDALLTNTHIFSLPPCLVVKFLRYSFTVRLPVTDLYPSHTRLLWYAVCHSNTKRWHSNLKYPGQLYVDCSASNSKVLNLCRKLTYELWATDCASQKLMVHCEGLKDHSLHSWPQKFWGRGVIVFMQDQLWPRNRHRDVMHDFPPPGSITSRRSLGHRCRHSSDQLCKLVVLFQMKAEGTNLRSATATSLTLVKHLPRSTFRDWLLTLHTSKSTLDTTGQIAFSVFSMRPSLQENLSSGGSLHRFGNLQVQFGRDTCTIEGISKPPKF